MRILLFCEAEADARTARRLVDEVLAHRVSPWVRDMLDHAPASVRRWVPDTAPPHEWLNLHRVRDYAAELGVRPVQGHFGGRPAEAGALMLATMARIARELDRRTQEAGGVDVLMLVWDMDQQGSARRNGLAQGAAHVPEQIALVLGCPDPVRETWVLAGFEAETEVEARALQSAREELGFHPHGEPHRLTAQDEAAKLSAKRIVRLLGIDPHEREVRCLRIGAEERRRLLGERGEGCGLAAFLQAIEREILPRVDPTPRR